MASVLIVDDDEDVAAVLRELLRFDGYEVRVACHGLEGLEALRRQLPDVVILDVEMPIMTGPAMASRMLVENCGMEQVPVILLSGATDLGAIAEIVGTPYVLAKASAPEALLSTLTLALTERRPPAPPE